MNLIDRLNEISKKLEDQENADFLSEARCLVEDLKEDLKDGDLALRPITTKIDVYLETGITVEVAKNASPDEIKEAAKLKFSKLFAEGWDFDITLG